jgi:oligopeptide transport system ATP-binding protein
MVFQDPMTSLNPVLTVGLQLIEPLMLHLAMSKNQAQIVDSVRRLRDELGMTLIWITHDLGVGAGLAQRVLVMYGGFMTEEAPVRELFANPLHPYTLGLLGSLPRVDERNRQRLVSIDGLPPVLYEKPNHCPFAPRCKYAIERCWNENPPLMMLGAQHKVACWVDAKTGKAHQYG